MLFPSLTFQRPHKRSKPQDHIECLERRLALWGTSTGVRQLLDEGKSVQRHLSRSRHNRKDGNRTSRFTDFICKGKVKDALRCLSGDGRSGVHSLSYIIMEGSDEGKLVLDVLKDKHPAGQSPSVDTLLPTTTTPNDSSTCIFLALDDKAIRQAALRTQGSAGPSGVDAIAWKRWCTSHGRASVGLCKALAAVARRICMAFVDPSVLMAFNACRLIPLDKNPGVRPIGVVEVCCRIIGKAVMRIVKLDLIDAVAGRQFCARLEGGCEAAVHCMSRIFERTGASFFVDASNAFNSLNRATTLLNASNVCPALAPILINTYREPVSLFVNGETLLSTEGTTQGDPLGMAMYAIGVQPLINSLESPQT